MPCRTDLSFGDLEVFENDDRTRTFLALGIAKGRNEVSPITAYTCIPSRIILHSQA